MLIMHSGVAIGYAGCTMHTGPALWGGGKISQNVVIFQDESPKAAENRSRVNTFLATADRVCIQIKERSLA